MANDAVAGNATRVAQRGPGDGDDPVRAVLAAYTHDLITAVDETLATFLTAEVDSLTEIDISMGRFAATAREAVLVAASGSAPRSPTGGGAGRSVAPRRYHPSCPRWPRWSCCTPSPWCTTT